MKSIEITQNDASFLSKSIDKRPLIGFDIEEWRGQTGISKYKAQYAFGFRSCNHYNDICDSGILSIELEILLRLHMEKPTAVIWESYTLKELFLMLYANTINMFSGTPFEVYAMVDLRRRFTKMFGRSVSRGYQWLESGTNSNENEMNAYSVMECILSKLKDYSDPAATIDRIAKQVLSLRGIDLDSECPVPTLNNPPVRLKTGRKSKSGVTVPEIKNADISRGYAFG